ncbi:MAG: NAD(P)-dependent oxidoreductase [Kofleriaceae bacterium]
MKIAIIGATGNVGRRLVDEALRRHHHVVGISRDVAAPREGVIFKQADAANPDALGAAVAGSDAVISALRFVTSDPDTLLDAVRRSSVKRYLVVGGAGSLETATGKLLVESEHFPAAARDEATGGKRFLDALRAVNDLDWTMLCPSAQFIAGERTGTFRVGGDTLLTSAEGKSWISFEDFAIAMLDEVEAPKHVRARFTVGY